MPDKIMSGATPDWAEHYRQLPGFGRKPGLSAIYRRRAEDFRVSEQLGFDLTASGEHQMLYIRKTGRTTADVAEWLSREASVKLMDVGYCGLKDKFAVTEQWFSLYLPGKPDIELAGEPGVEILTRSRHNKKLRRGIHKRNQFVLVLRECEGAPSEWDSRLESLMVNGFPNYFGEQRFGFGFANLQRALAMFAGTHKRVKRNQKSLYLSAARSWLFNRICAERLLNGNWNCISEGETLILEGTRSFFVANQTDEEKQRLASLDIHTSGAFWGRGRQDSFCSSIHWHEKELEMQKGLEKAGLKMERRALRAIAHDLTWNWLNPGTLELRFELNNGCFATAVLREIADCATGANK